MIQAACKVSVKSNRASAPAPTVLITGFEPFGGESLNPSWLVAQALRGKRIAQHRVVALQLPCVFDVSLAVLRAALKTDTSATAPKLVVCLGQAGGRAAISFERIAVNINDARIADNAGAQPVDTRVVASARAPAAYFSTLPIKAMQHAVAEHEIASEVSQTAGTFVCNHVFYGLMHALKTTRALQGTRGGFVHVPFLPEQTDSAPSMPLELMIEGIALAIRVALATGVDAQLGAGALS